MFIVTAAAVVWVKRSDPARSGFSCGTLMIIISVSVGTVYAVRNLRWNCRCGREEKLVWANGVFRSWIAGTKRDYLRDIIQGQKVAKLWEGGGLTASVGGRFSVYSINGFLLQ